MEKYSLSVPWPVFGVVLRVYLESRGGRSRDS